MKLPQIVHKSSSDHYRSPAPLLTVHRAGREDYACDAVNGVNKCNLIIWRAERHAPERTNGTRKCVRGHREGEETARRSRGKAQSNVSCFFEVGTC